MISTNAYNKQKLIFVGESVLVFLHRADALSDAFV